MITLGISLHQVIHRLRPRRNSRDADEDREGDILLDHGLRGGSLILLNLLRESRDSGEDEESGDCEISDGLVVE